MIHLEDLLFCEQLAQHCPVLTHCKHANTNCWAGEKAGLSLCHV